jgi:peptidyl-tRNA hydrolase
MVATINKMVEKGEWVKFVKETDNNERGRIENRIFWLMQPDNFFNLMGKAIEEGVIGKWMKKQNIIY